MRFMMLIKSDAMAESGAMPDVEILTAMGKYNEELINAGKMLAGEGLHPSSRGFRVTNAGGRITVTDGPFPEVKDLVAGFWMIRADSLQEAAGWATRVPFDKDGPSATSGGEGQIEVRRVFELEDFPVNENESGWREQESELRQESQEKGAPPLVPGAMRYMLIMKGNAEYEAGAMPDEKAMADMGACIQEMADAGVFIAAEGLHPTSRGARVIFSNGKPVVTDGPFPETKELFAGYTIIQVNSKEEALEWARKQILANGDGQIEVRQVFTEADFPPELIEKAPEMFEAERQFRERHGL